MTEIIKRLFRKRLKKKLLPLYGVNEELFDENFYWIYNAPLTQWKDRLFCACLSSDKLVREKLLRLLYK